MKSKIYHKLGAFALALSTLVGCNKFLDVEPKGQQTEYKQFSSDQGYYDAMYGVYRTIASKYLYGGALSIDFLDHLGQMLGVANNREISPKLRAYNYDDEAVEQAILSIWSNQYFAINALNNIIKHTQEAGTPESLKLVEGEALGLRAFLHFDLLRLFAVDYRLAPQAVGLPYADSFNLQNKTVYNVEDTYQRILEDLDKAETLLQDNKELSVDNSDGYKVGRAVHFNIYAVWATKARIYLTQGDYDKAALYARKVIESGDVLKLAATEHFNAVKRFPTSNESKTTAKELIFGLNSTDASTYFYQVFFNNNRTSNNFITGRQRLSALYETSGFTADNSDVRYLRYYENPTTSQPYIIRFIESEKEKDSKALRGLTLIRLPEVYYILAEALYDSNRQEALEALNAVRKSRGLNALSLSDAKLSTREAFEQELLREQMREQLGEGLIFYALKHYNRDFTALDGRSTIKASNSIFVLPRPTIELEYGNKQTSN